MGMALLQSGKFQIGLTRIGNAQQVLATVLDIVTDYVNKHQPNMIYFSAYEPSRIKAYMSMAKRFLPRFPSYELVTKKENNEILFNFVKDGFKLPTAPRPAKKFRDYLPQNWFK